MSYHTRMIPVEDLCDRCAEHKAHFEIELARPVVPGEKIEVGNMLFPRAGYLCRSCATVLQDVFPGLYTLTVLEKL